ncbi:MAG: hypothetical protein R3A51_04670 [Nannocystaceae bacterium]|nr:hypothetical protein [Myxococcales bacterium]
MTTSVSQSVMMGVTRRVVDQFTEQGLMFTALDVSNVVKKSLRQVRHREVAPLVRELFEEDGMGDDYQRTLIDVMAGGKSKAQAFLYHLKTDNPQQYDDDQRSKLALAPVVSASSDDDLALDPNIQELELQPGKDGRLRIPRKLLQKAGVLGEDIELFLVADGPDLQLVDKGKGPAGEAPIAALRYAHPSLLHLPRQFVYPFDPDSEIIARVDDEGLFVEGMPR